jgi:enoyl-CoA hydratase/carnithine racemase
MPLVDVRREGPVAVLTLNRPEKLNALSTAVERALAEALASDEVATARSAVLSGAGRAFSAGADVTEMTGQDPSSIVDYYRTTGDVYERVAAARAPVVAAVHGFCLGGGLELALACDLRVAGRSAVFGLPEVELGILPSSGGTLRLVRAVGTARARELVVWRRRFSADDAYRFGLVAEVVDDDAVLSRAIEIAGEVASAPAVALEVTRSAIDAAAESGRDAALLIERLAYTALAQTDAHREAVDDFGTRRRGGGGRSSG